MIHKGPFCECIKTGLYFTTKDDDRVQTGDLYFDFARQEFQIRGIPSNEQGVPLEVVPKLEMGPVAIHAHILEVHERGIDPLNKRYSVMRFTRAYAAGYLMAHIEEWYGDRSVLGFCEKFWEIRDNLAWVRS